MNAPRGSLRTAMRPHRTILGALALAVLGTFASAPTASANEPLEWKGNLNDFIAAGAPDWQFARALGNDTCWPSSAFVNGDQQAPPAELRPWPDTDYGCAAPGTYFPTYTTVKTCFGTEVRVIYTLFFPKDGFSGVIGHAYDFEHVVTTWKYAGDNKWTRSSLLLSSHGGHKTLSDWTKVESADINADNWGYGKERPSVYVGWGKHAMFNNQGGLTDWLSQTTDNEYRHADYAGDNTSYVIVEEGSAMANKFDEYNWGSASSDPTQVSRDLCNY
ncbi:hypothetical protein OG548_32530 [Streptomyces sp. NBC_01356]|uniref:NPP1 family protein n=1 Tax=Streptomyces sp. NBC_01356 TaxID=2903836 RepID=UPI002E330337|nr:NPP1 family protein [Streptomyces sp. NBC_01356]